MTTPIVVWIVESGDYAQRGVEYVAESVEAAVAQIKHDACASLHIQWEDLRDTSWQAGDTRYQQFTLTGHARGHDIDYYISPMPLIVAGERVV